MQHDCRKQTSGICEGRGGEEEGYVWVGLEDGFSSTIGRVVSTCAKRVVSEDASVA